MPSSPPTTTTLPSSVFNRWAKALRVVKEGSRLQEEGSEGDQEWQAPVTCQKSPLENSFRTCSATSIQLVPPHTRTLPCFEVEVGGNQMTLAPNTFLFVNSEKLAESGLPGLPCLECRSAGIGGHLG